MGVFEKLYRGKRKMELNFLPRACMMSISLDQTQGGE